MGFYNTSSYKCINHYQFVYKSIYNENRYGGYVKETTTPSGLKCQHRATHLSSMNDEETLTPQGSCSWLQNIIINRYNERVAPIYSIIIEKTLKERHTETTNSRLGIGAKNTAWLKYCILYIMNTFFLLSLLYNVQYFSLNY